MRMLPAVTLKRKASCSILNSFVVTIRGVRKKTATPTTRENPTVKASFALEEAFFLSVPAGKKVLSEEVWVGALGKFHARAKEIRSRYALGVIGRARAAYLLQQRLITAGFPADVVRKVMFTLILNSFSGGA